MKFKFKKNSEGFSLIELMIVVGILGILATLAAPRMTIFMAKSKQAEAKTSLSALNMLQETYNAENSTFTTDLAALGWTTVGVQRYTVATTTANLGTATSGTTGATAICKNQANADVWQMNANKTLCNQSTALGATATACGTQLSMATTCP